MSGQQGGGLEERFSLIVKEVNEKLKSLAVTEERIAILRDKMEKQVQAAARKVVLDVGGQRFAVSKDTLLLQKDSFFHAMLGSDSWRPDADGSYFIDRNPLVFPVILEYLRTGKLDTRQYSYDISDLLKAELDYYLISIPESISIPDPLSLTMILKSVRNTLQSWLPSRQFTLIYKATRDGFDANDFHQKCDNRGAILAIIESTGGYRFGGYASRPWQATNNYVADSSAFIFTLTNPHNIPATKYALQQANHANVLLFHTSYHVTFGAGIDLHVSSNSHQNNMSHTGFAHAYADTTGNGNATFTGALNFKTREIEVFSVI